MTTTTSETIEMFEGCKIYAVTEAGRPVEFHVDLKGDLLGWGGSLNEAREIACEWLGIEYVPATPVAQTVIENKKETTLIHITRPAFQNEFRAGETFQAKGQTLVVVTFQNNVYYAEDGFSFGVNAESGKAHWAKCRPATEQEVADWAVVVAENKAKIDACFAPKSEAAKPADDHPVVFTKTSKSGHKIEIKQQAKAEQFALFINGVEAPCSMGIRKLAKKVGPATHIIGDTTQVGLTAEEVASFAQPVYYSGK